VTNTLKILKMMKQAKHQKKPYHGFSKHSRKRMIGWKARREYGDRIKRV
jgi:hypothetical protein